MQATAQQGCRQRSLASDRMRVQAAGTQRHSCCELKAQGMFAIRLWLGHACRQQQRSAGFAVEWECRGAPGA